MKKRIGLLVRVAISLLVIGVLFHMVDLNQVIDRLRQARLPILIVIFAIALGQGMLIGFRWSLVAGFCGASLGAINSIRLNFIGMFFNQLLPGTLGGDSMRAVLSVAEGLPLKNVLMGILIDRALALMALVVMVTAALPWLAANIPDGRMVHGMFIFVALAITGFGLFVWLPDRIPRRLRELPGMPFLAELGRNTRATITSGGRSLAIVALAIVGNLFYGVVAALCAKALGIAVDPLAAIILMMPALLATALPISVAGWGVREGALVVALGQIGVPAADALALSILWGIVYMLGGVPGGVLWLLPGRGAR
jgi:uncharacterized membrane protein YbhN (UPF0104 family)